MPRGKYKSITINQKTLEKMGLSSGKVTYELEKRLEEQAELQSFALKITKVPQSVRVYGPFSMKKRNK